MGAVREVQVRSMKRSSGEEKGKQLRELKNRPMSTITNWFLCNFSSNIGMHHMSFTCELYQTHDLFMTHQSLPCIVKVVAVVFVPQTG